MIRGAAGERGAGHGPRRRGHAGRNRPHPRASPGCHARSCCRPPTRARSFPSSRWRPPGPPSPLPLRTPDPRRPGRRGHEGRRRGAIPCVRSARRRRGYARSDDARSWKDFLRGLLPLHGGRVIFGLFRLHPDNCPRSPAGRRRPFFHWIRNPDIISRVFSGIHAGRAGRRVPDNEVRPKARNRDWRWRVEHRFRRPCSSPRRIAGVRPDRTSPIRNPGRRVDRAWISPILQSHARPLPGDRRRRQ